MVRNPGLYVSDGVPEGPAGENVISIAVPVLGEQGEFRGVLVGMFSRRSPGQLFLWQPASSSTLDSPGKPICWMATRISSMHPILLK